MKINLLLELCEGMNQHAGQFATFKTQVSWPCVPTNIDKHFINILEINFSLTRIFFDIHEIVIEARADYLRDEFNDIRDKFQRKFGAPEFYCFKR